MGKKCRFCHKLNQFSKMCLLRKGQKKRHRKGIHSLDDYDSSSSDNTDYDYDRYDYEDIVYVEMLSEEKYIHRLSDDWTSKSRIYVNKIQMQIDTESKLRSYSGHIIKPLGSIKIPCYFNNNIYEIEFQAIEQNATSILGSDTCQKIGLIQRMYNVEKSVENTDNSDIQNEYSD